MPAIVVERREGLRYEDIEREYQWPLRPVVVPGLCADWPAFKTWTLPYLRDRFPRFQVRVDGSMVALGPFIDEVLAATPERPCRYLRECYLAKVLPEVLPELSPIPGQPRNRTQSRLVPLGDAYRSEAGPPELLISGPGTFFPVLHYDLHHLHAFITQLQGDKEFTVFPPGEAENLYPREDRRQVSRIDCFDPVDLARFPRFANATPIRFRVNAGDTVFVPSGWWHFTRTLSPSLAITWNSVSRANWRAFTEDHFLGEGRQRGLKPTLKRLYLRVIGVMLTAIERGP